MSDLAPLAQFALLLVRPGMLILVAPIFGGNYAPAPVKIGLTVLLALALLPSVSMPQPTENAISIALVVTREAAIGFALGLAVRVFINAVELAGHMTGFQLGLSYSAIVDPQSGVRNNMIASLYANLVLVTFLLVNGHHAILRALGASYERVPMGGGQIGGSLVATVVEMLGLVFVLGTRLAAPLILVMLVVELGIGLVSRAAPMLNLMVIGAPLRLLVGLVLLGVMIPMVSRVATGAADTIVQLGLQGAQAFR
ncbi:MAG: flagellar biosynthetic protein FliR [Acidobacteria bacterium]|nr:flagellar biosynthetic protein FliR [Acidobacteriota bacterium]